MPSEAREAAARTAQALAEGHPDARWVPKHNLHVTLAFLGRTSFVDAVLGAVSAAVAPLPPLTLHLTGTGAFPDEARARVLWIGLGGHVEGLATAAQAVQSGLAPLGFEPEDREFSPHVTIARMRMPARASLDAEVERIEWRGAEVVVYESTFGRAGPIYKPLHVAPFQG